MSWQEAYQEKLISVEDAAALIESGDHLTMSPGGSCPIDFMLKLGERAGELEDVTITSGLLFTPLPHLYRQCRGHINHHSVFVGPLERFFLGEENIEITSYHFSQTDNLFTQVVTPNVVVWEVSPPNEKGYMSFGPLGSFCNAVTASVRCEKIICQVNPKVPWISGSQSHIHVSEVDYICEAEHDLAQAPYVAPGEIEMTIAGYIRDLIPDGACIQLGVGKIPNAVGEALINKNDLGIHTEMLTDSMIGLCLTGVVNNRRKTLHPYKTIAGAAVGTKALYDFIDHNPTVDFHPISYVNNPLNIAKIDNFMSINSALTVDLTGQVCSETIGYSQYSGTGGQVDFVRGSNYSKGGKAFIALNSVSGAGKGQPKTRIVSALEPGTIVTTPRTDVEYILTEHGVANLKNKSIEYRVNALIEIAHPDFRNQLREEAIASGLLRRGWQPAWRPAQDIDASHDMKEVING